MQPKAARDTKWFRNWRLLALLALLALAVPAIWYVVYAIHVSQDEDDTAQDLSVIAQSKAREIENWLAERRGDTSILAHGSGFVARVAALVKGNFEADRSLIVDRLTAVRDTYGYQSIELLDRYGATLVAVGEPPEVPERRERLVKGALATRETRMSDLHLDSGGRGRLNFSIGLFQGAEPVGVVLLHVDPNRFLYPLVQAWPTASESGETLLVRKDGDSVLYLSALRHRKEAELRMRLPLSDERLPAAVAVKSGRLGTLSGLDYRGVPVQVAWRPVTGTPWMLLAKIDQAEVLVAARQTANWAAAIATFTLLLVGLAMVKLFQQQRRLRDLALETQSGRLQAHFYDLPFIGMAVVSPDTGKWLQANARLCEMFGYTLDELRAKTFLECTHPDDVASGSEAFGHLMRGEAEGQLIEKRYLRKNGTTLYARLDARLIRDPGGAPLSIVATIEDITQRHEAEVHNRNLTRLYATLSRCNSAVIQGTTEIGLLNEVCRVAVEAGGMRMAWAGMVTPGTTELRPVASFGTGTEYLDGLEISIDAELMSGRGPSGTAVREDHPIWCQNFNNDPRTVHWRAQGARFGWRGSASLPLRRNGKAIGCLSLYVDTTHAFDAETQGLLTEIAMDVGYGLDTLALASERAAASTALAESEERYRMIFDNSQDGILLTDEDGGVLAANAAACRIFGRTREDLLQARREDLVDASDPRVATALALRHKQGWFAGEMTLRRGNGERFPAEVSSNLFHESGGAARSSMIVSDLTEKRRSESTAERYLTRLQASLMQTVEVVTKISEMRDQYMVGHEKRVALIGMGIAAGLGLDEKRIEGLRVGAYLHDIGKIAMPSEILSKPGKLSAAEFELIKGHPQAGYDVLKDVDFPWPIADIVLQHHERINGSGYPKGLKGDAILLEARILAVADVVEAMTSHRPYRPALGIDLALAEIERGRGSVYDPEVVDACLRLFRETGFRVPDAPGTGS